MEDHTMARNDPGLRVSVQHPSNGPRRTRPSRQLGHLPVRRHATGWYVPNHPENGIGKGLIAHNHQYAASESFESSSGRVGLLNV